MKSKNIKNKFITMCDSKEWYSYPFTSAITYYAINTIVKKARELGGEVVEDCVIVFSTEEGILEFDLFMKNFLMKS